MFKGTYKGRPCAAKLLTHHAWEMATGGFLSASVAVEGFHKECKDLEVLEHENIVQHYATVFEQNSNLPILVMELMDYNLKHYIQSRQENKIPLLCQISLCLDISKGLNYLHSKGIIHRDLCDVNILLTVKGGETYPTAKVADFGMGRLLSYDYVSATLTGLSHRAAYLPSEARDDPSNYSCKLDIYSYGVIAVQIVQVKEFFRKKSEVVSTFKEIPESHFLKNTIGSCLLEDPESRPRAADITKTLSGSHSATAP